ATVRPSPSSRQPWPCMAHRSGRALERSPRWWSRIPAPAGSARRRSLREKEVQALELVEQHELVCGEQISLGALTDPALVPAGAPDDLLASRASLFHRHSIDNDRSHCGPPFLVREVDAIACL